MMKRRWPYPKCVMLYTPQSLKPQGCNMSADLVALAVACEKADVGSFDLNKAILATLGYTWRGMAYWFRDDSHSWIGSTNFTGAIDSALTLVPEGHTFN